MPSTTSPWPGLPPFRRHSAKVMGAVLTSLAVALSGLVMMAAPASAATAPSGFSVTTVASGILNAVGMEFAPDGRLVVMQQDGTLRLIKGGVLQASPIGKVPGVYASGHAGMLGMTFDPAFASNGRIYVVFTTQLGGFHVRISRLTLSGDTLVAGSEVVLTDLPPMTDSTGQPSEFHFGADLEFGQDGMLYASIGEGFVSSRAQSLSTPLGKILRFAPDGSIPTDNPFYNSTTGPNRAIYALGVRNPWKMVREPGTSRLLVSDVGGSSWEELNLITSGSNYGWPTVEGMGTDPAFTNPVQAWPHTGGSYSGCAAAGADFYRPANPSFPASYVGKVFYTDHCGGWVRVLDLATGTSEPFMSGLSKMLDVKVESATGQLWYLDRQGGVVGRVAYVGSASLAISTQPASQSAVIGSDVTFSVNAFGGTAPLTYQWFRNGVAIAGATSDTLTRTAVTLADNGARFRVNVKDATGTTIRSNAAVLTVVSTGLPTISIGAPALQSTYGGGDTIGFAATATDPEDGDLPSSSLSWTVDLHHDDHTHPAFGPTTSGSGQYTIPQTNETEPTVFYRFTVTATDSSGNVVTSFRDVMPRLTTMTLNTQPSGLQILLDGQPTATPVTVVGVEGVTRELGVPSPQVIAGNTYTFTSWSDGGTQSHFINTPVSDTTYTAAFAGSGSQPTVALAVGSLALNSVDLAIRDRIAGLGYTVTPVDDNAATTTSLSQYDVVVISRSVNDALGKNWASLTKPVMVLRPWLYDDYRMTGATAGVDYGWTTSSTTIAVATTNHPLAVNLGPGSKTVLSTAQTLPFGQPVASAAVIARHPAGKAVLFTFRTGDALAGGAPAAGCRMAYPGADAMMVSPTPTGATLFAQSLGWLASGCP